MISYPGTPTGSPDGAGDDRSMTVWRETVTSWDITGADSLAVAARYGTAAILAADASSSKKPSLQAASPCGQDGRGPRGLRRIQLAVKGSTSNNESRRAVPPYRAHCMGDAAEPTF